MMKNVGTIKEIWRYPVKGMAGEQIESCEVGPGGLAGDRIWAVVDVLRKEIQSCKFRPQLLGCTATSREESSASQVDIELPCGEVLRTDDLEIHARLSELVGKESTLEALRSVAAESFFRRYQAGSRDWLDELKETFSREPGEPLPDFTDFPKQAQDFVTVPGSFFLVSTFHIITSGTMQHMKRLLPDSDWDIRRFRPNIVIETSEEGLVEQGWIGKQLTISELPVDCTGTAVRCGAVTRAQVGIPPDKCMLRTIVKDAEQNLGIYGKILEEGTISVGDKVFL